MKIPLIYIVDNDLISTFDIKVRLHQSKRPCKVTCFEDIESAYEMLGANYIQEDELPDIILISFDMPDMDGEAFVERLENSRLINENVDVYIFASYGIPDICRSLDERNIVNGYFKKPLSNQDIKDVFANFQDKERGGQISV